MMTIHFSFSRLVSFGLLFCGGVAAVAERPNIVFLFTDDQDVSSVGCYGNTEVKTPHIDRIAADGIRFDNHYVTTAICMASRASVMTGLYEYRTGCNFDRGALAPALWKQSYPMVLRGAGYRTAFAGKFGFEIGPSGQAKGRLAAEDFDVWGGGSSLSF